MPPGWPTLSTRTMRFFSITMSTGPIAGAPVPSISVAPRRMSLANGPSPSARGGAGGIDLSFLLLAGVAGVAGGAGVELEAPGGVAAMVALAAVAESAAVAGAGGSAAAATSRIIMAPQARLHREALVSIGFFSSRTRPG